VTARKPAQLLLDNYLTRIVERIRARATRNGDFRNIVVPIDDVIGHRLIATGRWELTILDAVRDLLAKNESQMRGVFLDVGANIGLFSIALSKYFEATIAFEANPITFNVLNANIELSRCKNVVTHCLGLSDSPRSAKLYAPKDNLGWATLGEARHPTADTISIRLETLDNAVRDSNLKDTAVAMIKIDVEGHEAQVLAGARETLKKWRPVILYEAQEGDGGAASTKILEECGYNKFYTFRRSKGLRHIFSGMPVVVEDYDRSRPAELVCAMAKRPTA
jgi:FkbM family methyltransferase